MIKVLCVFNFSVCRISLNILGRSLELSKREIELNFESLFTEAYVQIIFFETFLTMDTMDLMASLVASSPDLLMTKQLPRYLTQNVTPSTIGSCPLSSVSSERFIVSVEIIYCEDIQFVFFLVLLFLVYRCKTYMYYVLLRRETGEEIILLSCLMNESFFLKCLYALIISRPRHD